MRLLTRGLSIAAALAVTLAPTVLTAPPALARGGGELCAAEATSVASAGEAELTAAYASITWGADYPGAPSASEAYVLEGACGAEARGFAMNLGSLADGRGFAVDAEAFVVRPTTPSFLRTESLTPAETPNAQGKLESVLRIGVRQERAGLSRQYLGLWRSGDRSTVLAFAVMPDGRHTEPREVLTITRRLLGIGYFPAPDSAAGRLGLVVEAGRNRTLLLGFDWPHDGWFMPDPT